MKTPSEFYSTYLGKVIDYDGAYGPQCVDAWKIFCAWCGVPVKATPNNWADGYWYYRDSLGYAMNFDYILEDYQNGDWVIWAKGSKSHPSSHIAMYFNGMEFSENQGGNGGFSLKATSFSDALGALRWKGWTMMNIEKGYHRTSFDGTVVDIIRATAANGYKLHYISAEDNKDLPPEVSHAVKDLMAFDSDKLGIVGAVNANYFVMSDGMHLGCEGDGVVNGYYQFPKLPGILCYYITKDGAIGAHDQSGFYLEQNDIQMICAPYSIPIHQSKRTDMISTSFGNKESSPNTQTAALKIEDDWCLAIFSSCLPSKVVEFAEAVGATELLLMDSGGSSQMFECATTGSRRGIRHTSRYIPGVLVLAKELDTPPEPEPPVDIPNEPEPSKPEEPVEEDPKNSPGENSEKTSDNATDISKGLFGMSNEVYDVLKFIAQIILPAAATLIATLGDIWGLSNVEAITKTIVAVDAFLGVILGISTNVYNKNKDEA